MSVQSGQSITVDFVTSSPTTGAATAADSLPTGTVVVNGTDNGASVTVTSKTGGKYSAAVTLPALTIGDVVQLRIAATVGGVAGIGVILTELCDVTVNSRATPTNITAASGITLSGTQGTVTYAGLVLGPTTITNAAGAGLVVTGTDTGVRFHSTAAFGSAFELVAESGGNDMYLGGGGVIVSGPGGGIGQITLATSQPLYAPAKVGDAMTLTGGYDAAKTAATQASVDALSPNTPIDTTNEIIVTRAE